jgi:hypothetical protein
VDTRGQSLGRWSPGCGIHMVVSLSKGKVTPIRSEVSLRRIEVSLMRRKVGLREDKGQPEGGGGFS